MIFIVFPEYVFLDQKIQQFIIVLTILLKKIYLFFQKNASLTKKIGEDLYHVMAIFYELTLLTSDDFRSSTSQSLHQHL